jgi:hypothetical protein
MKPFGWFVPPNQASSGVMQDISSNPNSKPIMVGSQKSSNGGYNSVMQTGDRSIVGDDSFKTRWGATRNAKKTVKYNYDPSNEHEPLSDHIDPSVRKFKK